VYVFIFEQNLGTESGKSGKCKKLQAQDDKNSTQQTFLNHSLGEPDTKAAKVKAEVVG